MYYQGKKRTVGVAFEATRGTAVNPTYWFPRTDFSFVPKIETQNDEGNVGTLVESIDSHVTKQWAEGNLAGKVYPNGIGYFLKCALGKVTSSAGTGYTEHTFEIDDLNSHPSLTIATHDPVADYLYPLAVLDSIGLGAEKGGDYKITLGLKSRKAQSPAGALSADFVNEESFVATDIKVYVANNLAGLDTANNICLQSFDLTIKKNTQDIECLSSQDPIDYMNTSMTIEGSLEMYWENNTYRDMALNDIAKAIRIEAVDGSVLIGNDHPEITIDLPKIKITDWTEAVSIKDIIKQSIKFTAHYSITDGKAISVLLRNTKSSY